MPVSDAPTDPAPWVKSAEYTSPVDVLSWQGIAGASSQWQQRYAVVYRGTLYLMLHEGSPVITRQVALWQGRRIIPLPYENAGVGLVENTIRQRFHPLVRGFESIPRFECACENGKLTQVASHMCWRSCRRICPVSVPWRSLHPLYCVYSPTTCSKSGQDVCVTQLRKCTLLPYGTAMLRYGLLT
jgi:hypothetical protein